MPCRRRPRPLPDAEPATEEPLPEEPPAGPEPTEPEQAHPEHDRLARENAQRLEAEIEALRTGHLADAQHRFRIFFEQERRLHTLFKDLRPLHPHDRHRLWKEFKQVGAGARRAQQEEWESRRYQSIEARELVDEKLRVAEGLTQSAESGAEYRRAESLLNEVRNLLANAAPDSPGQILIGPDRRACWDRWRAARDTLRQRHGGRQEQARQELAARVAEVVRETAEAEPLQVMRRIKELQALLGGADLRRGQFEELRKRLSAAWQQAQARMAERRREQTEHRAEWRGRMEGHLTRWRETLEQKRGQLEHLVGQAAKLIEMEKNARAEDFAEQVRQWQAQTAEKRRRAEESVAELEERIRSAEKRLGRRGGARRARRERAPRPPATPPTLPDEALPTLPDEAPPTEP